MREQEAAARLDDVSTFGLDTIALIRAGDQAIPNALLPRIHDVASDFDRCRSTGRIALDRLGKSSSAVSRATLTAPSQRAIASMRDGMRGIHGNPGTLESVSYRFHGILVGSNPTLSASSYPPRSFFLEIRSLPHQERWRRAFSSAGNKCNPMHGLFRFPVQRNLQARGSRRELRETATVPAWSSSSERA
jgi:hypothetical protein